jgi:hypothetical protein
VDMKNSKGDSAANCSLKQDMSLRHLQAELARLDILLQREVRRWQVSGQDPADPFRGLYVSDTEVQRLSMRSLAASWGHTIALDSQEEQAYRQELQPPLQPSSR